MPAKYITPKQIALLHVAKTKLGISEEDYRSLLYQYGADSSKELKQPAFKHLLKTFERLGFKTSSRSTAAQMLHIKKLGGELGLTESGARQLYKRITGKTQPETPAECSKVIEGLKAMLQRRKGFGYG